MSARPRSLLSTTLLLIVVTLFGLELSYRLWLHFRYGSLSEAGKSLYLEGEPDDPLPARLRPGATVTAGKIRISVGPHGVRSGGRPAVPGHRPTVLFVGGSSVFGASTSDANSPPAVAERNFRYLSSVDIQAVNGAVPGFTVPEASRRVRELIPVFRPEVVVIVESFNDAKRVAGSTICPMSYPEWRAWSRERWAVAPWWRRSDLLDRITGRPRLDWGFARTPAGEVTLLPAGYEAVYIESLRQLELLVTEAGGLFIYGVQPLNITDDGSPVDNGSARGFEINLWPLTARTGVQACLGLQAAARRIFPEPSVIDFSGPFRGRPELFTDHVHLSDKGVELWGKLMAESLLDRESVRAALGLMTLTPRREAGAVP